MARGHAGIPKKQKRTWSKSEILTTLRLIDNDALSRQRILAMETDFAKRIREAINALPSGTSNFGKFKTSPFVLLMQALKYDYSNVSQIEKDILPAKLFSSMETSAGKMMELVTLPHYHWNYVESTMHSAYSALDGRWVGGDEVRVATLKSGPACLNDEMAENFADTILGHLGTWAADADADSVFFTYGVLYGTPALSNKKDWHILRNLVDKLGEDKFTKLPWGNWGCEFDLNGIKVTADVRIGADWWTYLGGEYALLEILVSLIRACVSTAPMDPPDYDFEIMDLGNLISGIPEDYTVSLLQGSQLQWLFLLARHFTDELLP